MSKVNVPGVFQSEAFYDGIPESSFDNPKAQTMLSSGVGNLGILMFVKGKQQVAEDEQTISYQLSFDQQAISTYGPLIAPNDTALVRALLAKSNEKIVIAVSKRKLVLDRERIEAANQCRIVPMNVENWVGRGYQLISVARRVSDGLLSLEDGYQYLNNFLRTVNFSLQAPVDRSIMGLREAMTILKQQRATNQMTQESLQETVARMLIATTQNQ